MAKTKQGSASRFGARYGASLKKKVAEIERVLRTKKKCPECRKFTIKRVSSGIWECRNCSMKIAGNAYNI
ncbi:MAG: 50S ribosomal protein L37ae [Nanoarchaeota archaeon]